MSGITTDIRTGLAFCTRLPLKPSAGADLARAAWTFPLVGALIGVVGGGAYWLTDGLGLDPLIAATLAVAASFNEIAAGFGLGSLAAILVAAIVLLLGHGINLAMAALSVLVHGVRLNMLEFSGHADLQWSGSPYQPFHLTYPDNLRRVD